MHPFYSIRYFAVLTNRNFLAFTDLLPIIVLYGSDIFTEQISVYGWNFDGPTLFSCEDLMQAPDNNAGIFYFLIAGTVMVMCLSTDFSQLICGYESGNICIYDAVSRTLMSLVAVFCHPSFY